MVVAAMTSGVGHQLESGDGPAIVRVALASTLTMSSQAALRRSAARSRVGEHPVARVLDATLPPS
jgi:hypothetical protein